MDDPSISQLEHLVDRLIEKHQQLRKEHGELLGRYSCLQNEHEQLLQRNAQVNLKMATLSARLNEKESGE